MIVDAFLFLGSSRNYGGWRDGWRVKVNQEVNRNFNESINHRYLLQA